jgi:hypothetical protein
VVRNVAGVQGVADTFHLKADRDLMKTIQVAGTIWPIPDSWEERGDGVHEGADTVGELSRLMYAKGYDFGHFLAMAVPTMIIEALVRVGYGVKRLHEGHALMDAVPFAIPGRPRPPKLQTMLFAAHLIATGVNAGRVAITKNPLDINYPEWVMFAKSSFHQLKWVFVEKEVERLAHVQTKVDGEWDELHKAMTSWWR